MEVGSWRAVTDGERRRKILRGDEHTHEGQC